MNKLQGLLIYHFTTDMPGNPERVELISGMVHDAKGVANITTRVNRDPDRNASERCVADSVYWTVTQAHLAAYLRWYLKSALEVVPPIKGGKLDCGLGCEEMLSLSLDDVSYFSLADAILADNCADYVRYSARTFGIG